SRWAAKRRTITTAMKKRWRWLMPKPSMPRSRIFFPPAQTWCRSTSRGCSNIRTRRAGTASKRSTVRSMALPERSPCICASAMPRARQAVGLFLPAGTGAVQSAADFDRSGAAKTRPQDPRRTALQDHRARRDRSWRHDGRNAADRSRAYPSRARGCAGRAHCRRAGLRHEVSAARDCLCQNEGHGRRRGTAAARANDRLAAYPRCPLQRLAVPFPELGRRLIGFLQKAEQQRVGIARLTHGVVGQDELAEITVVKTFGGLQPGVAVTGRLRIGVDEKR